MEHTKLISLYQEFQATWPKDRIERMTLKEYTTAGSKESFCYWIESKLQEWGSIWGGSSYKFGIYNYLNKPKDRSGYAYDDQYAWCSKYGKNPNEVFDKVKNLIIDIITAVQNNDLKAIDKLDFGDVLKWKIAFHYQNIDKPILVPIYKREWLISMTNMSEKSLISDMQTMLIDNKPINQPIKEYSNDLGKKYFSQLQPQYWVCSPGKEANYWEECHKDGIIAIGWPDIEDLTQYEDKYSIAEAIQSVYNLDKNPTNDALCCWQFAHDMKEGDVIYAKLGRSILLARGIVSSNYHYDPDREDMPNIRAVEWQQVGEVQTDIGLMKTLTKLTNKQVIAQIEKDFATLPQKIMQQQYKNYIDLLLEHKNLILTGAPGTGKTYLAKAIAKAMNAECEFVQFHPSYDYTDFVEGLRPISNDNGNIGFAHRDGIFKEFCKRAQENLINSQKSNETLQIEATLNERLRSYLENAMEDNLELKTKTGSAYHIESYDDKYIYIHTEQDKTANIRVRIAELLMLLEISNELQKVSDIRKYTNRKVGRQEDSYEYSIYTEVKKIPATTLINVQNIEKKNFVFIIDEINRGEISKIFGELFFAIEPNYRGTKGALITQYSNMISEPNIFDQALGDNMQFGHFFIPENVYILGTMNDIDRSVESMDFAMRRRFGWKEILPTERIDMWENADWKDEANARMDRLNAEICKTNGLGDAFQIGPAYFLKLNDNNQDFKVLWDLNLCPLLKEYLRGFRNANKIIEKLEKAYNLQNISNLSAQNSIEEE